MFLFDTFDCNDQITFMQSYGIMYLTESYFIASGRSAAASRLNLNCNPSVIGRALKSSLTEL